ncbi:glycine/D-amino acid oxidase-like deaminating enzyme [Paraburkholderia caballeronis]|uniref:NAD(P)/FAD-dependent oxidoreductase n=1 Tax=Paraburkholderia caballeronis TaxID=416943 RepID=UPI00106713E4|nr:FAD-dependent oxidoreductase [Paraburkholderia caballeronis]TDV34053.1 glycine/D-amino acid oxidase-like deaminating enzyme [Paraburkholderia caballeronis]
MTDTRPVAVIGGGLVGICTAAYLQRAGLPVLVIGRQTARDAASLGNAGCINGSSVVPVAMPGVLWQVPGWLMQPDGPLVLRWRYLPRMAPWLARFVASSRPERVAAQARALRSLLGPALDAYRPLLDDAHANDLLTQRGYLIAYSSREGMDGDAGGVALREQNGVAIDTLDANALREFEPTLSPRFIGARYIAETGHTTPHALLARLTAHAVERGARIVDDEAVSIETNGAQAVAVHTRSTRHDVRAVVVAAGAWSARFVSQLGDRVLLDTERGYHVEMPALPAMPSRPVMWAEGKLFATPMQGRLRAAGTVELAGLHAPPDWRRADLLLRQVREMFPQAGAASADSASVTRWQGFRPSTPDSLPVLGPASRVPNAFYAFGHGHVGLTAAASTGRAIAALVAGERAPLDLSPFSVARFR